MTEIKREKKRREEEGCDVTLVNTGGVLGLSPYTALNVYTKNLSFCP